jgi:hypothetical protein
MVEFGKENEPAVFPLNRRQRIQLQAMAQCAEMTMRINPERICFVKFIIEGYDGLAMLSTVDSRQGLIRISYPIEVQKDVEQVLRALAPAITPLPAP